MRPAGSGDRKRFWRAGIVWACLTSTGITAAPAQDGPELGITRGARPGAITLEDVTGGEVNLGDYFGRTPILLQFWATWCENCKALEPRIREAFERYGDRVAFFTIAVGVGQSKGKVLRHLDRHPLEYPTLWDGSGSAVREFRAPTTSYIVLIDAEGIVAHTGIGPDQDIEAAIRKVLDRDPGG